MTTFKIFVFVTSLFVLYLFPGFDIQPVHADFTFGVRMKLDESIPTIDATYDMIYSFSSDGLEMYISSLRPGGVGDWDLYVLRRTSVDQDWGSPESLGPVVNSASEDGTPSISVDGLTLYFHSNRPGGYGGYDLYVTTRPSKNAAWGQPLNLGPDINSDEGDYYPCLSTNGLELYFGSSRSSGCGGSDIYVARRANDDADWEAPTNLGPVVNSAYGEHYPCVSPDGLLLLFSDHRKAPPPRPGGFGNPDMWMTKRTGLSEPWGSPINMGPTVNGPKVDIAPVISADGSMVYFCTMAFGMWDYWQAPILPVVDFNGDEAVDAADIDILIDCWGTDEPLCDIGPYAWGDGVVDVEDLVVLVEHIVAARADVEDAKAVN